MRKQALFLAATVAVVIGCGGGGHHSSTKSTTTTTGTTGGEGMTVSLDTPTAGAVDVTYLTGEGRAAGDLFVELTQQTIGTPTDGVTLNDIGPFRLDLNRNTTVQLPRIDVPFTLGGEASHLYTTFTFNPNQLLVETDTNGTVTYVNGPTLSNIPFSADARIRAFPGRTITLQVNVAPSEFPGDASARAFDVTQFKGLNYSTDTTDSDGVNKIASRLSDFVRFPLSGLAANLHPDLRFGYGAGDVTANGASYVYFSGDNIALSNNVSGTVAGTSVFQEVATQFSDDPTDPVGNSLIGLWSSGTTGGFQGTYDLRDILPSTIETDVPINRLVSVYGGFRDYDQVLSGGTSFEMILFPNSSESFGSVTTTGGSTTGRSPDLVAIVRTGGVITNMYFGSANLSANAVSSGTFELFPIKYLGTNPASTAAQGDRIVGTLSGYLNASGVNTTTYSSVRKLSFTFGSTGLPANFTSNGTVTVFRI